MLTLLEDIRLVRGYKRSLLVDLTRGDYHLIPNLLHDCILKYNRKKTFLELKEMYQSKYSELFSEYTDFLLKNEFIVELPCELINNFSSMEFDFQYPYLLENIIIALTLDNFEAVINFFCHDRKGLTKNYGILVHPALPVENVVNIVNQINKKSPNAVNLVVSDNFKGANIIPNFKGLVEIFKTDKFLLDKEFYRDYFRFNWPKFSCNIMHFTEAMHFHTYFNKTLFIKHNGSIHRHYADNRNFGNLKSITYSEFVNVIYSADFQYLWKVKKNETKVCQECELRMICIDNRVPYKVDSNEWGHNESCSYNPYIAKWKGEEGFIPVEKCGFYNKKGRFVLNKEKVDKLNFELWGE